MDGALEFFGKALWFIFGFGAGTAVMYFCPLIVEWIDEGSERNVTD